MTGSIKAYTPNFEFIIPEFNISGWHDYLEENFRSIDALFYNLFGINNFKGQWKNSTIYNVNDVVFIGEDADYSGRLVKVLVQHTTASTGNFTEFFTANPSYYELFADASTAQIFAQEAKDWATKMDGPVESGLYSSKYYSSLVTPIASDIQTVSSIATNVSTVASISSEINAIVTDLTNINTVAAMKPDVDDVVTIKNDIEWIADNDSIVITVANNSTNITTTVNNINNINTVAGISSNITSVANNATNINKVATDINKVKLVADDLTSVDTVAIDISNIIDVAANKTNIDAVAGNATNINAVNSNKTNIDTVATNNSNINTVASNISNINTTATNISDINTAASNITAIQNAPTYATNASNSATLAQEWATSATLVDNIDYSAKYYAEKASHYENPLHIGQTIQSTIPLTDAGLHLLDGSVINGSGSYADFVDYIAGLVSTYPDLFETEANWQTSVTNYGVCGKFVYDSINNTVRLPKLYANERYLIKSYSSGTSWYRIYSDGWCEQGGYQSTPYDNYGTFISFILPFTNTDYSIVLTQNRTSSNNWSTVPPLLSFSKVTNGVNTQSQGSEYLNWRASGYIDISSYVISQQYNYIVIATTTKTDIQVDIDEIAADLNGKVDKADLAEVQVVVETYQNGASWYRLYSDGWCEQGGLVYVNENTNLTVNFIKTFNNTNYFITATNLSYWDPGVWSVTPVCTRDSGNSFRIGNVADTTVMFSWYACGYTS